MTRPSELEPHDDFFSKIIGEITTEVYDFPRSRLATFLQEDDEVARTFNPEQWLRFLNYDRMLKVAEQFGKLFRQNPDLLNGLEVREPITEVKVIPFQLGTLAFHALLIINPNSGNPKHIVAYISRFPSRDRTFGDLARIEFEGLQTVHSGLARANNKVRSHVATIEPHGLAQLPYRGQDYPVFFTRFIEDADELHVRFLTIIQGSHGSIEFPIYHHATGPVEVNNRITVEYKAWINQFLLRQKDKPLEAITRDLVEDQYIRKQMQQQIMLVESCTYFWLAAGKQFPRGFAINTGDFMAKFNEATGLFDFVYLITTRAGLEPMDEATFLRNLLARRSGFPRVPKAPYKPLIENGHDDEINSGIFSSLNNDQILKAFRKAKAIFERS